MTKRFVLRIRWIVLFFMLAMCLIIARLYVLQVLNGKQYIARADAQFTLPQSPLIDRAAIYFSDKNNTQIVAASLNEGFSLALNPSKITDAEVLYAIINPLVPIDHAIFIAKATKQGSQYVPLAQHLPTQVGQTLVSKNIPGIIISEDRWREYPGGSLAAQELGFVAYNNDNIQEGRYGLELQYNNVLTRRDQDLYTNFFVQLFSGVKSSLQGSSQTGDIITTIEPSVQAELERTLVSYMGQWHPVVAGGIIMDPKTGEIYAMAVNPTFDLNAFGSQTNPVIFANPMVQNVYEMGSIVKPLTMAAGIDSGAITENTTYNDTGCITVDKKSICNYDLKARGVIPMQQILSQSLNVGASYVATQMGQATMRDYFINHYGMSSTTGIDLPGEIHGLSDTLHSPRQVDYDTASFGQGIAMTPVETARALAVLASGGYLVTPHFVKAIHYDSGITHTINWGAPQQVLKPTSATAVTHMLTTVVDTTLAHGTLKMDHYSIAAKTGTAQIANPSGGGYYSDKYLHSFFGYLPSYNAKFVVFLFALEPKGAQYASETWSPQFQTLTHFLVNYYDLPPDR